MDERTSDADLVAMARSRDREAFGALVERHQPMAQRVAYGVVGERSIAAELANEAMLRAYLSLDRLRDAAMFQSWLHGIVLNVCRSYIRDRKRAPLSYEEVMGGVRHEGDAIVDMEPTPQEAAESRELHQVVLRAVESLPPKARVATLLYYYDQLSVREVADTLGMSVSAVKNRLHGARARLREVLLPFHIGVDGLDIVKDQEDRIMVEVKIADVVEQRREDKDTGESWPVHVALLVDEQGRRLVSLWIGEAEGRAIAMGLKDLEVPRPLTFTFVARGRRCPGTERAHRQPQGGYLLRRRDAAKGWLGCRGRRQAERRDSAGVAHGNTHPRHRRIAGAGRRGHSGEREGHRGQSQRRPVDSRTLPAIDRFLAPEGR